ncbi:hypothetical protein FGO68_gene1549 [Halteria grandinella]|uniref:Uncharacterized protein n=1 Tax=Halteria grandinella TaxID=5974 RepID=A0A8J8P049_HALGN|nr:hypothetical protein FGO68_gene1549 [Halteria grandinella]
MRAQRKVSMSLMISLYFIVLPLSFISSRFITSQFFHCVVLTTIFQCPIIQKESAKKSPPLNMLFFLAIVIQPSSLPLSKVQSQKFEEYSSILAINSTSLQTLVMVSILMRDYESQIWLIYKDSGPRIQAILSQSEVQAEGRARQAIQQINKLKLIK